MATKKKSESAISIEKLCEKEKKQVTAELIARGLSPKQIQQAVGITDNQIEEWLANDDFKYFVENIIQVRLVKIEQAKNKSDEILMQGLDTLSIVQAAIMNMTAKIGVSVSKLATDKDYVFNKSDPDIVFKLIGMMRELKKEINGLQLRNLHLQSDGPEKINALNGNWSPNESIRVIKLVERIEEVSIEQGIPLDTARKMILKKIEITDL